MSEGVIPFSLAENVLKRIDVGIFVLNKNFEVQLWNNFMVHHSGHQEKDMLGKNLFDAFPDLPKPWFTKKVNTVIMLNNFAFISWENRPFLFRFAHNRPITGGADHMYQNCMLMPVSNDSSKPESVCVVIFDVTDTAIATTMLKDAMERIADISNRDGLTGIYNRRYLETRLESEFDRTRRYGGTFSMILFDLDFFKKVNDTYGHLAGDKVLVEVARRMSDQLRTTDVVGRYGGEEFALILPETPIEGARVFGDRLREMIELEPVIYDNTTIPVTVSMGATEYSADLISYDKLILQSDVALYASKASGRNCLTCYSPELET
ncbi:MAG: diguanylate cyclase, partial [Burkholderiales bacterium]|nr:diguanylate cyclase [Burkholderiales bacterium]